MSYIREWNLGQSEPSGTTPFWDWWGERVEDIQEAGEPTSEPIPKAGGGGSSISTVAPPPPVEGQSSGILSSPGSGMLLVGVGVFLLLVLSDKKKRR